jgi:hypothetical protein
MAGSTTGEFNFEFKANAIVDLTIRFNQHVLLEDCGIDHCGLGFSSLYFYVPNLAVGDWMHRLIGKHDSRHYSVHHWTAKSEAYVSS